MNKLFTTVLVLLFAACSTTNKQQLTKIYEAKPVNFSISYPDNWWLDSSRMIIFAKKPDSNFVTNIKLGYEKLPIKVPIADYAKSVQATYTLQDSAAKSINLTQFKKDVFVYNYTTVIKNIAFANAVYILVHDSNAYTIQCNSLATEQKANEPLFQSIINNIKF
jgi:hypothetical protein